MQSLFIITLRLLAKEHIRAGFLLPFLFLLFKRISLFLVYFWGSVPIEQQCWSLLPYPKRLMEPHAGLGAPAGLSHQGLSAAAMGALRLRSCCSSHQSPCNVTAITHFSDSQDVMQVSRLLECSLDAWGATEAWIYKPAVPLTSSVT